MILTSYACSITLSADRFQIKLSLQHPAAKVHQQAQYDGEGYVDFHGQGKDLALAALACGTNGGYAYGYALGGYELACAGSYGVGSSYPSLGILSCTYGDGCVNLQLAQEDAGAGAGAGDEAAHGADEGSDGGVHEACGCHRMVGNGGGHAAVAHDFRRGDDADDGDEGGLQAEEGGLQHLQHI